MTDPDAGVETGELRSFTLAVVPDHLPKPLTPATYKIAFAARVRLARESAGLKTTAVARKLRVAYGTYMQYEDPRNPSLMPHILVGTFCRLCGSSIAWLMDNRPDPFDEADSHQAPQPKNPDSNG